MTACVCKLEPVNSMALVARGIVKTLKYVDFSCDPPYAEHTHTCRDSHRSVTI